MLVNNCSKYNDAPFVDRLMVVLPSLETTIIIHIFSSVEKYFKTIKTICIGITYIFFSIENVEKRQSMYIICAISHSDNIIYNISIT